MEQETKEQSENQNDVAVLTPAQQDVVRTSAPSEGATASMPAHVYTIGRIEARFPRLSVEKEFAQATGRAETAGQTDQQALYKVTL